MRTSIVEALRQGITEAMEKDPSVFCIGEDISIPGGFGGAFTVTLGLETRFPDRMVNTPISEAAIFGMACGAAAMGMRPIADVQYGDFLMNAGSQVVNQIAKLRYMSGGKLKLPLVMRAPVGVTGRGAQHSQNLESFFLSCPGIKIVAPSTAYDALGLLRTAIRDDDPVLIFEHKLLYGSKGARAEKGTVDASSEIPEGYYEVPIGKGIVRRPGKDVTLIGSLLMSHFNVLAASELEKSGIDAEVIDLRSIWPLDMELIEESVKKTGRVVIVEESPKQGGLGAEIGTRIAETIPDYLLAPVTRVAAPNTPAPFSPVLEKLYVPQPERITRTVRSLVEQF
ncbi:MAG: alpha-ketoacid dehydrogenase subunit beta [Spirochaetia bacterium]|jgi:pyruvate dehydrogenase E1 component beta subunit